MSEITAWDLLQQQESLTSAAADKYPWDPKACTHHMGVDRQLLYACLTCKQKSSKPTAVCYSCSIHCHTEHDLVELFTRRALTCDCGTVQGAGDFCQLRGVKELEPTDNSVYGHNFDGKFCDCDVEYTEHETSTMLQCFLGSACQEDWYHERCILGLSIEQEKELRSKMNDIQRPPIVAKTYEPGVNVLHKIESALESTVSMPTTSELSPGQIGTSGSVPARIAEIKKEIITKVEDVLEQTEEQLFSSGGELSDDDDSDQEVQTLDGLPNGGQFDIFICWKCVEKHDIYDLVDNDMTVASVQRQTAPKLESDSEEAPSKRRRAQMVSLFLAKNFRKEFKLLAEKDQRYKKLTEEFPFLVSLEETYEPPIDDDATSSLVDSGERALQSVPREQAVTGIEAYSMMRDKLRRFLAPFAEQGKTVTERDVQSFFGDLKD